MSKRLLCWLALLLCAPMFAQESQAGIRGIVKDSQGAAVPGVPIEAQNLATNEISRATTNEAGQYAFPVLLVGSYRLTATAAGFKKAVEDHVDLPVGGQVQRDFTLETGAATEGVAVSAGGAKRIPIKPGATGHSDLLLEGIPNTGVKTGSSATSQTFVPAPEAVAEFKIQNSNYDAQYGSTSSGAMTASVKSGTNQLHGSLYWLNKNTILAGNGFDQNRVGAARAAYHENNPGLEFDGPVYLPHLFNGRNRTFIMWSYEISRDSIPTPSTQTVPYPAAVAGNFNTTLQSNGQPITIYDPATTTMTAANTYTRQPFPGDTIPATRRNAAGVKIASYIPAPNTAGATNNFVATPNARTDAYDSHVIRIDQQINGKNHFFSRFVRGFRTETNGAYGWQQAAAPGNSYTDGRLNQGGDADLTTILSPSTVLTSRVGYLRHDLLVTLYASGFNPTQLGFPSSLLNTLPPFFPSIQPSGYQSFGASRSHGNQFTESATWSWAEIVNRTVRRHQVKWGGEFQVNLENVNSPTTNFGSYAFTAGWTQQDALTANAANGNSIASLLLGMPSGGSAPINAALAYGNHYYGVFVQDDWRIANTLTLSYGLRWDYESPVTERNNQINAGFAFTTNSPVQAVDPLQPGLTQKGGLLFAGSANRMPYQRDLNNWQPRVGVAWRPMNKTVVRAGYGLSYAATFTASGTQGFSQSTPYNASPDGGITFSGNYLNNPYPTGILTPTGSKEGLATFLGQSVAFTNPNRVIPRVHQFSSGVQRELPSRSVLEVSYVGSRSQELPVSQNLDAVTTAQLLQYGSNATPNLTDSCSATSSTCKYANPLYRLLPAGPGLSTSTTRQQLLLPYPQFTRVTENGIPTGKSWYNSLQVRFDKRMSHGLNLLVSYTREKWLNATSYLNAQEPIAQTPDRTLSGTDTPNRVAISGNWAIPLFGRTHGIVGVFLKGWQANGILTRGSGLPLAAPSGFLSTGIDPAVSGANETKAFNTCTLLTNGTTANCSFNGQTLPVAFIQQYSNSYRTLSGYFPTIRVPRVPNADLSMFKTVTVHERWNVQFRAEAFNATNSPQFNTPNTNLTSTSAGVVSLTQVNDVRNVQLSLRVRF